MDCASASTYAVGALRVLSVFGLAEDKGGSPVEDAAASLAVEKFAVNKEDLEMPALVL